MSRVFVLGSVPAPLRASVRRIAAYDETAGPPVRRRQAPTGSCTLIVGLGDPLRVDGSPRGSFLAGLSTTAALTEFRGRQRGVQVDLSPLAALRLVGPRPGVDGPVDLDDLDGAAGRVLRDLPSRVAGTTGWGAGLTLAGDALAELLLSSRVAPDPEVAHAWRRLVGTGGRVPVPALAAETGWSRRHLSRRFGAQLGLSPTTAGRVLRFRRAADLLVPPPGSSLPHAPRIADVAAMCGFADHAHLDREFRALAGCTPGGYVTEWAGVAVDPAEVVRT